MKEDPTDTTENYSKWDEVPATSHRRIDIEDLEILDNYENYLVNRQAELVKHRDFTFQDAETGYKLNDEVLDNLLKACRKVAIAYDDESLRIKFLNLSRIVEDIQALLLKRRVNETEQLRREANEQFNLYE